jgi:prepilin-type N-terminal cleavage/methylation domain-containing protein
MKLAETRRSARTGFTLVEIVVVLAIILILVSLTTSAVLKFLRTGKVTKNRVTIGQFETGLANAKTYFKLSAANQFPSRLYLAEMYADYNQGDAFQLYSLNFLQRMFPRLWRSNTSQLVDWDASGGYSKPVILEGDQCLVFFLGGVPSGTSGNGNCLGFSSIGSNPADTSSPSRIGPFFDFQSDRLVQLHGNAFFSYMDDYKLQPYLYFSSYATKNGYNPWFSKFMNSDCATAGVWPYADPNNNYLNPNGFQIISAGEDGQFGPGTDLTNANPYKWDRAAADTIPQNGKDDQANFSGPQLGVPQ